MRVLKYRKNAKKRLTTDRHSVNSARNNLHVSTGDTVRVMRGDDRGKEGKVLRVDRKKGRVLIDGINIVKKHRKARTADEQSGIIEAPAPVHASNVMLLDPKTGSPTRTKVSVSKDKTKARVAVKSGEAIARVRG